jgi:hypothetical protein
MGGTNNSHDAWQDDFKVHLFLSNFKQFLFSVIDTFGANGRGIICIGLFPRAFCNHCVGKFVDKKCRNIHRDVSISTMNCNLNTINGQIKELIEFDHRFCEMTFLSLFETIRASGTWDDGFGGMLSKDGLHLSCKGNELVDRHLLDALNKLQQDARIPRPLTR